MRTPASLSRSAGVLIVACAALLTSCSGERSEQDVDSAAESAELDIADAIPFGEADLEIGRIGTITWLEGDRLALVDDAAQQILIFDALGALAERVGRAGDGPGEFRNISGIADQNGLLVVFESAPGPSRMHRRLSDGTWQRRELRDATGRLRALGLLSDSLVVVTRDGFAVVTPPAPEQTRRDSVPIGVLRSDSTTSWFSVNIGRTWVGYRSGLDAGRVLMTWLPLAPLGITAISKDEVWVCESDSGRCSVYSAGGTSRAVGTEWTRRLPSTAARLDSLRDAALANANGDFVRDRIRVQYSQVTAPDSLTALEALLTDPRGGAWALVRLNVSGSRALRQLDSKTKSARSVTLPSGFDPRAIGTKGIAGVLVDDDGSERAVMLPWTPEEN